MMEHLMNTLQGKAAETKLEQQKEILKQFLVESNKAPAQGGATTLKPDLLKKLTGESENFNMGEWLAKFTKIGKRTNVKFAQMKQVARITKNQAC